MLNKIRQIRHLRGAKARCTSKKIRAIGVIREHNIRMVYKIGCTSAVQNEKKYSFILHCIRFALSFDKIGCTSAV